MSSIFSDAGGYSWSGWRAPAAARYKIRIAGYSVWVAGGGVARWFYEGQGAAKAPVFHTLLWHRPNLDEVYPGKRNEPIGVYASGGGQTRPVGAVDFTPKSTVSEIEVFLLPGEVIRTDGSRLFRTRVNGTDEQYVNPLATEDGMPGYAVQWVEIEGPFYDDPVGGAGYRLLFDNLKLVPSKDTRTGVPLQLGPAPAAGPRPGGGRPPGGPGGFGRTAIREAPYEVESAEPRQDAERLLRSFLKQTYRRPVAEADVQRFLTLYDDQFKKGHGFTQSLLSTYSAVLASPGFVFVQEKPGRLDDQALATRLALFLWNSIPDDTLRALADKGELGKPAVLREQTERMLDDPKARRFVEAFTDYWLDLRKIDDTSPSTTLYNDYELDDPLKLAAIEETRLFFAELLQADLPARNIVASDFTFLNERLADHYGIKGVSGVNFRKVKLPADSVRGGLMTQASVLKVTANGTTTSPVLARALDHGAHPRAGDAAPAADGRGRRAGHPRRGDHPPAAGQAPGQRELRVLPPQDGPAGLRPGELRRDGRLARPLPGGVRQGEAGEGPRRERAGVPVPLRPAGRFGRRAARRPAVPGRARTEEAAGRRRGADRAEPGPAADGLRHRRAGAVLRPRGGREDPRRGEGRAIRRAEHRPRNRAERTVPEQVGEAGR